MCVFKVFELKFLFRKKILISVLEAVESPLFGQLKVINLKKMFVVIIEVSKKSPKRQHAFLKR